MIILLAGSLLLSCHALHVDRALSPTLTSEWFDKEMQSGFRGKPRRPSSTVRVAEDACQPEMFVGFNIEHSKSGFGSKVNNFMNQLAVAAYGNFSVSVGAAGEFRPFLKAWNYFFENPFPSCDKKYVHSDDQKSLSRQERVFVQELSKTDERYVEDVKRAIYKAHYRLKPDVSTHIQDTLKNWELPEKFFGVEIRHGDKREEADGVDTEDYAHVIQQRITANSSAVTMAKSAAAQIIAMESKNIRTVWLATIDPHAEAALQDALGPEYVIKSLHHKKFQDWHGSAGKLYYPGSGHVYDILMDVEVLRRSHTFIATASSNLARWVYFLRERGSKSISLDEPFLARSS